MSTSDLPISEAELSALASQLFATSLRPGPDSPPSVTAASPRGVAPDVTTATSAGATALGAAHPGTPAELVSVPQGVVPAPTSPGPEASPPGVAPVAPRGNVASPVVPFGGFDAFAVPSGLVPTAPGVLAAPPSAPVAPNPSPSLRSPQRGSAPSWPGTVPDVPHLGWTGAAPASQDADGYYFLQRPDSDIVAGEPVPAIRDDHEIFDVTAIRADFPILRETVNGKPLIWFDNAATTQKPQAVIDRLAYFYTHENSNIHRAAHELAARATDAYEDARDTVRRFLNAGKSEQIIFVRGTTEAINLVAQSWGGKHLGAGDEIVITHLEHHANIVPWQLLAQRTGAVLKVAPVDDAGNLLLDEFERLLGPKTKLVAATQVSNALGTVTPVQTIVELGHRYGARVLIDAAQSVPHIPIDVQALGADFVVFSGHKIFGPTGIGVLYGTEEALAETPPWQGGGNMIADVTLERAIFQDIPNKFEAGTGNIADAVGLGEALRYVERVGIERIAAYEHALLDYATPRLADIAGVRLVGTAEEKASVLSFVLAGHEPLEVGKALNAEGIAVRAGHHCAQPILRRLGLEATVRPSFAFYNTFDEIDVFIDAVRRIAEGSA
ncbi:MULTISPECIES: family 2A encapsulin nanocompartment cargo protein cysteine desulfurase [Mycobacteriaceae]|uniref:family 2A encapsulin nanocompartment cargo protein cysteine desulfurase n=1 Tax=Mycobacteriaceae TaxID=1762 RepID=UPI0002D77A6D|nr:MULTISPECIES: family 2A encapsulin nanocompartment cargo protein cysteine desulfurase [Mycobacteriaceae]AHC26508.2 cysteine desulfurase [Mycolicibacterium neoaurum VKM Ac-1815D]AMO06837.1 cysteine desulfurase [Mycolicibacterium neoaurum]AXK74796.1 SufS family cysteine desulfurase [Mycolicibacterium neoaurum]KJQ49076.1 cysteine desulfurase [Mycolicibacterium neoaurum]KUM08123.1 cysteine desulfurase [Mycolicibacterium neoaurum]